MIKLQSEKFRAENFAGSQLVRRLLLSVLAKKFALYGNRLKKVKDHVATL